MTKPEKQKTSKPVPSGAHPHTNSAHFLSPGISQLAVENAGEAVMVVQDERLKFCNNQTAHITGYTLAELTAQPMTGLIHPEDRSFVLAFHRDHLKGEAVPAAYAFRIITRQGAIRWVENRAVIISWEGKPASLNFLTDITERRQAEEAQKTSENTLRAIFNSVHDAIFIHDLDGNIVDVNDRMLEMYRVKLDLALSLSIVEDYSAPDNPLEMLTQIWQKVIAGENQLFEWKARRPGDGSFFEVEVFLCRLPMAGRDLILATVRDISVRKAAEADRLRIEGELERQRQELDTILNAVPAYIFYKDREHRFVRVNLAFAERLGRPPHQIVGKKWVEILPSVDPDKVAQSNRDDDEVMATGQPKRGIIELFPDWDERPRWSQTDKVPYRDASGNIIGVIGLSIDITERQQAEEALRQYAAELQARNDELDAFAHAVAHDLKNPLNVLTNMADILATYSANMPADELHTYLVTIARSGRKAVDIVEALLLLASVRQQEVPLAPLAMAKIVQEARQRLAPVIRERQAEIVVMPGEWPAALGYSPWIEEVWVNYLSNGLKYGGQPPRLELGAAAEPGEMVRFWVRDNGPGLSPEDQARLFRPFTQLRPGQAEGHGLGLSIVRRIVEKLGGRVGVRSEAVPGDGSVFSFTLPAVTKEKIKER